MRWLTPHYGPAPTHLGRFGAATAFNKQTAPARAAYVGALATALFGASATAVGGLGWWSQPPSWASLAFVAFAAASSAAIVPRTSPAVHGLVTWFATFEALGFLHGWFVIGVNARLYQSNLPAAPDYGPLLGVVGVAVQAGLSVAAAHYACRWVSSWAEYDADQPELQARLAGAGAEGDPKLPPRDRLHWALWVIGTIYTIYLLFLVFGGIVWPLWPGPLGRLLESALINPLMLVSTYGKMLLMLLTAYIAAYNPGLRRPAGLLLAVGHVVSVGCLLVFRYGGPHWDHTGSDQPYGDLFLPAAGLDAVFAVIGAVAFATSEESDELEQGSPFELESIPASAIRTVLNGLGGASFLFAVGTVVIRYLPWEGFPNQELWWNNDLQLANAITRYAVLGTIAWTIAHHPKLGERFLGLATATYITTVFAASVALLLDSAWDGFGGIVIRRVGEHPTIPVEVSANLIRTVIVDSVLIGAIQILERLYYRSEYGITTLSPVVARAVWALHEALFPPEEADEDAPASEEQTSARQAAARNQAAIVVQRVQAYSGGVRGRLQIAITAPFALLQIFSTLIFGHRPGFSILSVEERRFFLRKYLLRPPLERRASWSPELAEAAFKLTEAAHSLIVLAHYSSRNGQDEIGYIPPDARPRLQTDLPPVGDSPVCPPLIGPAPLPKEPTDANNRVHVPAARLVAPRLVTPLRDPALPLEVDFVVVGSGAGGAVAAWRLAQEHGDRVLVIERGPRFSPRQDFNHDEMDMIRKLYRDGGVQQTSRFDMTVLQGECVGGSTVINNATLFRIPPKVRAEWAKAGVDVDALDKAYDRVCSELEVIPLPATAVNQRVARAFERAVDGYRAASAMPSIEPSADVNVAYTDHLGEGLCNLGNRYLRKRSALETYLPWAEGCGATIVSESEVVRFRGDGSSRVTKVEVRTKAGDLRGVTVRKAVVAAGGALASSQLLLRSDKAGGRTNAGAASPIGKGLACNFAVPVSLRFDEEMDAFDGAQITRGAAATQGGIVYESYFNPPGALALASPFYFDGRRDQFRDYRKLMCMGALVASEGDASVSRHASLLDLHAATWNLGPQDVSRIREALVTLIALARHAGATHLYLPLRPGVRLDLREAHRPVVEAFCADLLQRNLRLADLLMATAHPQSGNRIATEPAKGVVGTDFCAHGWENLYVADASVFPSSIGVNPQLTINALAHLAAESILRRHP